MCDDEIVRHAHDEARRLSRRDALRASAVVSGLALAGLGSPAVAAASPPPSGRVVDLTHDLSPSFPMWPGNPPFTSVQRSTVGPGNSGYATRWLGFAEHSGTHVDAPAHKIGNGITVDRIAPADLVAPLVVISIERKARRNPRALLTERDIADFENRHGRIPRGALVALHTGWQPRTGGPDAAGFDPDAVRMLIAERAVVAIGTDTMSVDIRDAVGAHTAILGSGRYAVETMANLLSVPRLGARVVVGAPKFAGGTGGPARVLALT
jgi:kynurenine formamidase